MTVLLLFLACQVTAADEPVRDGIDAAIEQGRRRAGEIREEIKEVRRGLVREVKRDKSRIELDKRRADARKRASKEPLGKPRRIFATRSESARLVELEELLQAALDIPVFPHNHREPAAGDCGKLAADSFTVRQIAGPQQVLGEIRWHHGKQLEIEGLTEFVPITTVFAKPYEVWLEGVDTNKLMEGQIGEIKEPIILLAEPKQLIAPNGLPRTVATGRALTEEERTRIRKGLNKE